MKLKKTSIPKSISQLKMGKVVQLDMGSKTTKYDSVSYGCDD
jgi:hypothetical protein